VSIKEEMFQFQAIMFRLVFVSLVFLW